MKKIKKISDLFLIYITSFILLLMTGVGFWQVFSRYILNDASTFSEELLRYMLIWLSLLSAAFVYGKKGHIAITLLVSKFPKKIQNILQLIVDILIMLFAIIIMLLGGIRAMLITVSQTSASMDFSMGIVYGILPTSGAFIVLYSLFNIVDITKNN